MSDHFTLEFTADVRRDLSDVERTTLKYLVQGGIEPPATLPDHPYFANGLTEYPAWKAYAGWDHGPYVSSLWHRAGERGNEEWGLVIRQCSLKIEALYEDALPYVSWLATLCESQGIAGYMYGEETWELHGLLFIQRRELFVDFKPRLAPLSFVTGKPWDGEIGRGLG